MTTPPERRKPATLLFCDVSGSTALGERVDAEAVRELMFRYFHAMRAAIERHGGTVEKFAGDAVMAVFGVPVAHEDDALRACRAAVEMRERLEELNRELERRFETRLQVRIGINTGEVVAGDPAFAETFVSGDAVNVAARLEQAADSGQILVGETTFELVRDAVEAAPVAAVEAKGKSEPVPAYRLESVRADGRPVRPLTGALVGREEELTLLLRAFAESVGGPACRLVTLVGEPGVGKSRLASELEQRIAPQADALYGRCLSYGEGITFWPVAEIVRRAARIRHEDSAERGREKIAELVAGADDTESVARGVAQAIGLAPGGASADELGWAIRRLLAAIAGRRPTLVVIDDVHWAEDVLLDLLGSFPDGVHEAALLVVCLARPELLERRPDWPSVVRVDPLGEAEASQLASRLVGDEPRAEALAARARGNPLFLEELAALVESEQAEPALPTSLSALLSARLDRLEERARAALERGAVEGEIFHRGAVEALLPVEQGDGVGDELRALVSGEVLRPVQASFVGEAAFRFRHLLIRDAAYAALAKRLRADLHERFAGWLEEKVGDRLPEVEAIVGYHLERAYGYREELGLADDELAARAGERLANAGRAALARGDFGAAATLLGRAIDLLPRDGTRAELGLRLAEALRELGDVESALHAVEEARRTAAESQDDLLELHAVVVATSLRPDVGPEEMRRVGREAIGAFERVDDALGLARAWHLVGDGYWYESRWDRRAEALEPALRHVRRAGDRREEAEILQWLASCAFWGSTPAADGIRRCREILEEGRGHRVVEAAVGAMLGGLHALEGRFDEARRSYAEARELAAELGQHVRVGGRTTVGAWIEALAGDLDAAETELRRGIALLPQAGERALVSACLEVLGETLERQGRAEEAAGALDASESLHPPPGPVGLATRARLAARAEAFDQATTLAIKAVEAADRTESLMYRAPALETLGEILASAGEVAEASRALAAAAALYERKGNRPYAERSRRLQARLEPVGRRTT